MTLHIAYRLKWVDPGPISGASTDTAWLVQPTHMPPSGSPLIIYCHGAGFWTAFPTVPDIVSTRMETLGKLSDLGCTILMPALGTPGALTGPATINCFGSYYATARIEAWRVYMKSTYPEVLADKIALLGDSMGNYSGLGYARDYGSKVLAVAAYSPFCDVDTMRSTDNGISEAINAAWGLALGDPTPTDLNLLTHPNTVGVPWRGYVTTDDTTIAASGVLSVASVAAMAAHTGGAYMTVGTGGHDIQQWAASRVPWGDFSTWLLPLIGL